MHARMAVQCSHSFDGTFACREQHCALQKYTGAKMVYLHTFCRVNRSEQAQTQTQGMTKGSPDASALQHAVTSSQPEISSSPAQVKAQNLA